MARGAELVILFADVAGSTRLYEALGDAQARVIVARTVGIMTEATQRHAGRVVKTIGDEVMSLFRTGDHAASAAAEMQDAVTAHGIGYDHALAVRVGFHYGPVLIDRSDVFGDAVNVAAHLTKQARPGQVLATGSAQQAMSERWRADTRPVARMALKGKQGQTEVYEVIWRAEDMTLLRPPPFQGLFGAAARLLLTAGNIRIELGESRPLFTVGRDERNDVVFPAGIVSRQHARVEHRNGRFVLTDQSANGTFVVPDGAAAAFVHRDSVVLEGDGRLGVGEPPDSGSRVTIRYEHA
jgi:adenylate cyclase